MNYGKIQRDIKSGRLDANKVGLYIDKDMAWGFDRGEYFTEEEGHDEEERLEKEYGKSYGKEDYWKLLGLVGVHAEAC